MHTYMHAYIHTVTYILTCIHTYIHACMRACMHACMHAKIHESARMQACAHWYAHAYVPTYVHQCYIPTVKHTYTRGWPRRGHKWIVALIVVEYVLSTLAWYVLDDLVDLNCEHRGLWALAVFCALFFLLLCYGRRSRAVVLFAAPVLRGFRWSGRINAAVRCFGLAFRKRRRFDQLTVQILRSPRWLLQGLNQSLVKQLQRRRALTPQAQQA